MILRSVRVTLAPGKTEEYWAWAREILDLWDAHGVKRAGGPYAMSNPDGADVALWLTVHNSEEEVAPLFRGIYSEGRGAELIALRPAMVSESVTTVLENWIPTFGDEPPPFKL